MLTDSQIRHVQQQLFSRTEHNIYAVIDGAACPELRFKIYDWQPVHACLWSGKLAPDLEEVAPYMVKLERESVFTEWLIRHGYNQHWNIFVESPLAPRDFRKQIRKLQLVRSPDGENWVFRFYDPRVLNDFLQVSTPEQNALIFTGVAAARFMVESYEKSNKESADAPSESSAQWQLHTVELSKEHTLNQSTFMIDRAGGAGGARMEHG